MDHPWPQLLLCTNGCRNRVNCRLCMYVAVRYLLQTSRVTKPTL